MANQRIILYRNTNAPAIVLTFTGVDFTGYEVEIVVSPPGKAATTFSTVGGDITVEDDTVTWQQAQSFVNTLPVGVSTRADVFRILGGYREKLAAFDVQIGGVGDYFETPAYVIQVPGIAGPKGEKGDRGEKGGTGERGEKGDAGDITPELEALRAETEAFAESADADATTATNQAGIATTQAGNAAASAAATAADVIAADAARVLAETARDASFANAKGDTTIALARARVADGETFVVFAADALTYDAYRRESSSTETYLGSFPSADYVGEIDARIRPEQVLSNDDFAFAIRDPDTGQSPFAILADERGTIRNRHLAGIEENATEAMNGRVRLEPTGQALSWGVVQPKANGDEAVVLGVRSTDGRIINPSFGALWNAVFGGAVATGDLAEADTIIMHGPRIYAVEGRAIDLFAASLLPNRNSGSGRVFALQSVKADGQPLHALWRDHARIRCDDLGTTARLKIINDGIAGAEFSKSITVVKSASSKTASPRVALIGDSITNGAHLITEDRFDGYSVNPYFMGTRRPTTGRDSWAEGRGGWGATDYCYDRTTYIPLPAGQEAAALAAQTDNRNPFIRASTGGDDPSFVRNGYIFDYRYYLDRFGMADPDIVVINLGTNDIAQIGLPSALTRARDCIDIMIAQIRGACPSAIIGLALAQKGNSITENPNWYQGYAQLWLHWHETYGASSDVHVLSTHAMASDRLNFDMTTTATNAQTGQTKQILADAIHPDAFIGYPSYAEGIFSFIHAMS